MREICSFQSQNEAEGLNKLLLGLQKQLQPLWVFSQTERNAISSKRKIEFLGYIHNRKQEQKAKPSPSQRHKLRPKLSTNLKPDETTSFNSLILERRVDACGHQDARVGCQLKAGSLDSATRIPLPKL
ncbi:hypothetical protein TNCV_3078271 [Trichonephila clavipes]|nr:hypothetical protein TNCV_3078271 [Trichonephila clavipes]